MGKWVWGLIGASVLLAGGQALREQQVDRTLMPNGQRIQPAGKALEIAGRPVDMVAHPNGRWLYVKENRGLTVVDVAAWKIIQELPVKSGASYFGITLDAEGKKLYFSDAASSVREGEVGADGKVAWAREIPLAKPTIGGETYPCGLEFEPNSDRLFVCASRANEIQVIDTQSGKVADRIPTDIAPFDLAFSPDGKQYFVSCWGGKRPAAGLKSAPSAGTQVEVDEEGKARFGSLAVHQVGSVEYRSIRTGLQPSEVAVTPKGVVYVANANNDTVLELQPDFARSRDIIVKPEPNLPFGSAPNALAVYRNLVLVPCGGNNAIGVLQTSSATKVTGFFPTGWYPTAIRVVGKDMIVANSKGTGSRRKNSNGKGFSVYNFTGSLQKIPVSVLNDLGPQTRQVKELNNVREILESGEVESEEEVKKDREERRPIPHKLGEPSAIEHVVYIIKENRTYDQVFGDIAKGDGDPSLCIFGRNVTPNHHALAEQFVLLDNFYCNGVNSADGHAWSVEGNATSHFERSFGGWTRSYPFGDDPLSVSSSGFLWDNVLRWGKSFRNYGEFDYASEKPDSSWAEIYRDRFGSGPDQIKFVQNIGVERLRRYSHPGYPGWNLDIPDQVRASIFIRDLEVWKKRRQFPNMTIVYLPQDHTNGTAPNSPTPSACVADNDLALGRCVEALSKSPFWKKMAIFVIEDDPQGGFDHVDGHRSLCLVISPFAKRNRVVSEFYNQTGVLRTMQQMVGLPPLNQMDARSPLMFECFTDRPNYGGYKAIPAKIKLDAMNAPVGQKKGRARKLAEFSSKLDFRKPDLLDDEEEVLLNEAIWNSVHPTLPFPSQSVGAHGRGLKKRGLRTTGTELDE